jgi:hypothetical protein
MHEDYPSYRVLGAEERHQVENEASRDVLNIIRMIVRPQEPMNHNGMWHD